MAEQSLRQYPLGRDIASCLLSDPLQAPLEIHPSPMSWLTSMFAIGLRHNCGYPEVDCLGNTQIYVLALLFRASSSISPAFSVS